MLKAPEQYWANATYQDMLNACLGWQALCTLGFLITAFVLGSNGYAGFTAVFTGLVYVAHIAFSYYGMQHWKCRTFYGALLGSGCFLFILSLQTAIFWGEYSRCRPFSWSNSVVCKHREAMTSACVFAVFMLLALLAQMLVVFLYKDAILGSGPLNEGGAGGGAVYAQVALSSQDAAAAGGDSHGHGRGRGHGQTPPPVPMTPPVQQSVDL